MGLRMILCIFRKNLKYFCNSILNTCRKICNQLPGVFKDMYRLNGNPIYVFSNLLLTAETQNNYLNYLRKLVFTRNPEIVRTELISAMNIMLIESDLPRSVNKLIRLVYGLIVYSPRRIRYPLIHDNLFFRFRYICSQDWLKNRRSNMRTILTNCRMLRRLLNGIRNIRPCSFDRVAYVEYAHQHGLYLNTTQLGLYENVYNMDMNSIIDLANNLNIDLLTDRELLS